MEILNTILFVLVLQAFTGTYTDLLACCYVWYRHELYCLITMCEYALCICCVLYQPDYGPGRAETSAKPALIAFVGLINTYLIRGKILRVLSSQI
jgi:hypothetical protein